jgi:RNA polymerase sigma factor (TIGR02999 family)
VNPPVTELLQSWQRGDAAAFSEVMASAFGELQRMAASRLRGGSGLVTLVPGELVNEAVLRLMETSPSLVNRAHFFATMSLMMRSILVDRARERQADKRGGGAVAVTLTESGFGEESMVLDLLAFDQALQQLKALDERCSRVLEMTCFGGMTREAIAEALAVSVPTVDRDLKFARTWVNRAMQDER